MYFLLLKGTHLELGVIHKVVIERDKEGAVTSTSEPVVKTDKDLVAAFGSEKFRRISDGDANLLLKAEDSTAAGSQDSTDSDPAASSVESEVEEAAKKGAVGVAKPPGVDSTSKFPELSEWPNIAVYFKRGVGYLIADGDKVITETSIKRKDVVEWVRGYMEG